MSWQGFKTFVVAAFSDAGSPSSSRVVSALLAVWSMGLIAWAIHHIMKLEDVARIMAWIGGLPQIILALAAFAAAPYGLNQMKNAVAALRSANKGRDDDHHDDDH
jgi:hypothetical protein